MIQTEFNLDEIFTECEVGSIKIVKEVNRFDNNPMTVMYYNDKNIMDTSTPVLDRIREISDELYGNVLICGLGMGASIFPLLHNRKVGQVVVIEYNEDIINLVEPMIKEHDTMNKVIIKLQDAYTYETENKFDCIYLDIWSDFSDESILEIIEQTKEKYSNFLKDGGKIFTFR
jgi:hypothetical protein